MLNEDEIKALRTHLKIIQTRIPKELDNKKISITMGEYLRLLSGAQLSVINEILETIDKEYEESRKHELIQEFERLKST